MRRATPRAAGRAAGVLAAVLAVPAHAQDGPPPAGEPARPAGTVLDELLLRPRRATEAGRAEYARGNHPQAVEAFERAVRARPDDSVTRFNLADGLYKSGKQGEAAALFRALGADAGSSLAAASRYNLGNSLYQTQDYRGAIRSYREALRLAPGDEDARRNLELALRALKDQEEREKEQQGEQEQRERQAPGQDQRQPGAQGDQRPRSPQEKEEQRFRDETGMPKARAMQLLDALQQNEEAEQKRLLAEKRARKKKGKDW